MEERISFESEEEVRATKVVEIPIAQAPNPIPPVSPTASLLLRNMERFPGDPDGIHAKNEVKKNADNEWRQMVLEARRRRAAYAERTKLAREAKTSNTKMFKPKSVNGGLDG